MSHIPTHASYLADVARAAHQTGKDLTLDDVAAVIEAVNSLGAAADPCPTCNDQGAVGNILSAEPCPACAANGVSTVEDAPAALNRDRIEEIAREVYKVERFTKDDEVWHNLHWLTTFAKAIEKELRPAPAAGDALELLGALVEARRELHACQAVIHCAGGFGTEYVRDAQAALKRADAAIAAQRKGDA